MVTPGDLEAKGITQDEVSKLTKAMKDPKFRDHIDEYTREISDPAHRKEYLEYLAQLEAKGEMPEGQQLLRALPGCCVKTTILFKNGQTQKCFINIVHSDRVDDISFSKSDNGSGGQQVKLPYSLGPPRPDRDHKDEYCMTCDFAISSGTFARATQSAQAPQIMKLLVDTAAEGLATRFLQGHEEVKKDFKIMQRMACKGGQPMPMSVQAELLKDKGSKPTPAKPGTITQDAVTPGELKKMRQDAKKKKQPRPEAAEDDEEAPQMSKAEVEESKGPQRIRVPKHKLVHSGSIDLTDYMESSNSGPTAPLTTVPRLLKLSVELPTVKNGSDVSLEVTSYNVVVEVPDKYYLDLPLSFEIEDSKGVAKFDKAKQTLFLELPVVPRLPPPEALQHAGGAGFVEEADDGALSEGRGSDDELQPLEEERGATEPAPPEEPPDEPPDEPPPAAAPAAQAPAAEFLEVRPDAGTLRIARPELEQPAALPPATVEASTDACGELPAFVPASAFEGRRPGYFFSAGREGLGYYRDSRQPAPGDTGAVRLRPQEPAAEPGPPRGLLVAEVARPPPPAEAPAERVPLSEALQRHVEATASLCRRVACAPGGGGGDLPLEWRQTRQNLMLLVEVPAGHEVSDVRLRLVTQSLALTFCTRPARPEAGWQRYRFRRTLSLLADPRQWHAHLERGGGREGADQLVLVLRKVDRSEMWAEAFDTTAACVCVPVGDEPGADLDDGARRGEQHAPAAADGGAAPPLQPDAGEGAAAQAAAAEAAATEDSAELDAGAALVAPAGAAASAAPQGPAPAALVQSATTMGRGVLLSNRLVYQLL